MILEGGEWKVGHLQPAGDWCKRRIANEREFGLGTEEVQKEWFAFMYRMMEDSKNHKVSAIGWLMFLQWTGKTENSYSVAYRLGFSGGMKEAFQQAQKQTDRQKKQKIQRLAKSRKLIGASSRAKVAKAAETHMHLSKDRAAVAMADTVNLDPGTIRRYLSELFPGNNWKH
jgi:hypothetical protein